MKRLLETYTVFVLLLETFKNIIIQGRAHRLLFEKYLRKISEIVFENSSKIRPFLVLKPQQKSMFSSLLRMLHFEFFVVFRICAWAKTKVLTVCFSNRNLFWAYFSDFIFIVFASLFLRNFNFFHCFSSHNLCFKLFLIFGFYPFL